MSHFGSVTTTIASRSNTSLEGTIDVTAVVLIVLAEKIVVDAVVDCKEDCSSIDLAVVHVE